MNPIGQQPVYQERSIEVSHRSPEGTQAARKRGKVRPALGAACLAGSVVIALRHQGDIARRLFPLPADQRLLRPDVAQHIAAIAERGAVTMPSIALHRVPFAMDHASFDHDARTLWLSDEFIGLFPSETFDCIVAHELGHVCQAQADVPCAAPQDFTFTPFGRHNRHELEYQADWYGSLLCGKAPMLRLLEDSDFLLGKRGRDDSDLTHPSLNDRAANLRANNMTHFTFPNKPSVLQESLDGLIYTVLPRAAMMAAALLALGYVRRKRAAEEQESRRG